MKILIISTNALGDAYISAAAVGPLRKSFQGSEIHFLSDERSRFLVENIKVEQRFYLPRRKALSLWQVVRKIRRQRYDVVFSFFPGLTNTLLFFFARSATRIGYINILPLKEWHDKPRNLYARGIHTKKLRWLPEMNFLARIQLALLPLGIKDVEIKKPLFDVTGEKKGEFEEKVVLHFKSRSPAKSLSRECVVKIAHHLIFDKGMNLVFIGNKSDFSELWPLPLPSDNYEIQSELCLSDLIGLLLSCRLFIGIDSFPLHLADAYNINFIGLFGPTNPSSVLLNSEKAIKFETPSLQEIQFSEILEKLRDF